MYNPEKIGKLTRSFLERSVLSRRRRYGARIWVLLSITAVIVLTLGLHFHKISSNRPVLTTQMALVQPQDLRKCAYVFYATNDGYACSALVNMMRLRRLGAGLPPHTDLILIASNDLSHEIRRTATEDVGAKIYNVSSFQPQMATPLGKFSHFYTESSNKFLAFLLPNATYRRIILMDADCLILRPPHHLFELPDDIPFAAPKAYWYWNNPEYQDTAFWQVPELRLSRQDFLTSWIMSVSVDRAVLFTEYPQMLRRFTPNPLRQQQQVRPSSDTFLRLKRKNDELIAKRVPDVYDMDLFNIALGEDITALPPEYGMLDFEFVENDNEHMGSTLDDIISGMKGWAVHFSSGMRKPMAKWVDPATIPNLFPNAHPGYQVLLQAWNDEARAVCPLGSYPIAA